MGTLHQMVNSRESEQTARFRWRHEPWYPGRTGAEDHGYYVDDTQTRQSKFMGFGDKMFCEDESEGGECLSPGTQRFYDALNGYFENEQAEIAERYFGWIIEEQPVNSKGVR